MMHMRPGSDGPARTPRNTFSIYLYSVPVHCETREMHFLKCCKLFPWGMAQKQTSISFSPPSRHSVAHLTIWSLKMPLCNWCRRSGVKLENISEWGRSSQKGWFRCIPWHTTSAVLPRAASFIALRTLSTVHLTENWGWPRWSRATRHFGQWFSWQQAAKHCSGWSATYICHKNGEDLANKAICTYHVNPLLPSLNKRLQKQLHAIMEDLIPVVLSFFFWEAFKLRDWNVSYQDCGSCRWWAPNWFLNVPNGQIDWQSLFVTTEGWQLCFFRCDDYGSNCSSINKFILWIST